ncbi:hypothetical protein [Streptomyces sp. NPDC046712]|uniref:hypothetical protein n=1 Tax=Streptomyces sp. NPDC046712 TaxID=3154802 RepID=UPI0033F74BDC
MRTLAIAAVQTTPVPHDLAATWERFADQVRAVRATFPHVQLVVVPELMLCAEAPLPMYGGRFVPAPDRP